MREFQLILVELENGMKAINMKFFINFNL